MSKNQAINLRSELAREIRAEINKNKTYIDIKAETAGWKAFGFYQLSKVTNIDGEMKIGLTKTGRVGA